jgi:hypothetical protein
MSVRPRVASRVDAIGTVTSHALQSISAAGSGASAARAVFGYASGTRAGVQRPVPDAGRVEAPQVLRYVARVRIVDDAPMAIEKIRIPAALVRGIEPADFETGSLYQLLRIRYEVVATDAIQTTEPTVTDQREAELLTVPVYPPALLFERTTRDGVGRVIEYTRSVYRGDRYRITTHLRFDSNSG